MSCTNPLVLQSVMVCKQSITLYLHKKKKDEDEIVFAHKNLRILITIMTSKSVLFLIFQNQFYTFIFFLGGGGIQYDVRYFFL